jgi:hypothetical protein
LFKKIVYILFFNLIFSESYDEVIIEKAINELYNYHFDNSIILLDSALAINPNHPVPYFVKIASKWLDTQINIGFDSSYSVIYTEVENVIPIYEKFISEYPDSAKYYLYLGSSYGLRARVDLAKKDWFGVIYSAYKGHENIKYAQKLNPDLNDIYMPIGLMEYYASISSKPVQWLAKLFGIEVNQQVGINHLELSADFSRYSWVESGTILLYLYLYFENDIEKAFYLSEKLYKSFPGHPFFIYFYSESLIRLKKMDEFSQLLPKLMNKHYRYPEIQKNECELKLNYNLALYYFFINEIDESDKHCKWVINNYNMEMDWLLGYTWLLLGKINDLKGNRNEAINYYLKVENIDNLFNYAEWVGKYLEFPYEEINDDPTFNN